MSENNTVSTVLTDKVNAFKLIARDALRMKLISPRLSNIADLENNITNITKDINANDHMIVVANYEMKKLDTEHPDYAEHKARKEDKVRCITENVVNMKKNIDEINKYIQEQKDGIAKIELGETKVSLDDLNEMVDKLVREDAYVQVKS